jgi:AraC-like DNA-binding protein
MGKVMITLGRSYSETEAATEMEGTGRGLRHEILESLRLIERAASSGEHFRVSDLAQSCGLSVTYFTRQFCESVGRSPLQYFQQRRIQHACWLLLHAEHSVTEVADSLGFADAPHFVRVFGKLRGMTPSDYRKRFRDRPKHEREDVSP